MGFRNRPRTFTWSVASPALAGIPGPQIPEPISIKSVHAYCVGSTSCVFNIQIRTAIGQAGTAIMTNPLTAPTTGANATPESPAVAAGSWLWLDISTVNGTPTNLVVTITY